MRRLPASIRTLLGILVGILVSIPTIALVARISRGAPHPWRLVPEDASGPLRRVAIHYAPSIDGRALPVWRTLFAVLPAGVEVDVVVEKDEDFERFTAALAAAGVGNLGRFHAVPVHQAITTWSRDRMAALVGPDGDGAVLAPPRIETHDAGRAGDWSAPFALARAAYAQPAHVANFVFEGGDLAASRHHVFADVNLVGRNLGRGDASRGHLESEVRAAFAQDLVWLGDERGDVPQHHIMMYMVPLDDTTVAVGDVRLGMSLLGQDGDLPVDPDVDGYATKFDHVADLLAGRGFKVVRFPVVILAGGGSYVTYTNALFDRDGGGPVVYLPTYGVPALDDWARSKYVALGYRVVDIDVSTIYRLNGSLGCLVNVMERG